MTCFKTLLHPPCILDESDALRRSNENSVRTGRDTSLRNTNEGRTAHKQRRTAVFLPPRTLLPLKDLVRRLRMEIVAMTAHIYSSMVTWQKHPSGDGGCLYKTGADIWERRFMGRWHHCKQTDKQSPESKILYITYIIASLCAMFFNILCVCA